MYHFIGQMLHPLFQRVLLGPCARSCLSPPLPNSNEIAKSQEGKQWVQCQVYFIFQSINHKSI